MAESSHPSMAQCNLSVRKRTMGIPEAIVCIVLSADTAEKSTHLDAGLRPTIYNKEAYLFQTIPSKLPAAEYLPCTAIRRGKKMYTALIAGPKAKRRR